MSSRIGGAGLPAALLLALGLLAPLSCGAGTDEQAVQCNGDELTCSDDANELRACVDGRWQITHCMRDEMKLCEDGACVEPWRYGAPSWNDCAEEPRATSESLLDKAKGYEDLATRLHVHPELGWMLGVILPCKGSDCSTPGVSEKQASYQDIEAWQTGENDGLWSALYLTAEAYRYGATHDPEAADNIRLLLEGQRKRMAITGVPGLYTRQLINPEIKGMSCPQAPSAYYPDKEKDDNQWVKVGSDGCVQTVDPQTDQFVSSSHCGLDEFAGWCWLDNVSQDEYSGHMLAHAAVAALVADVPDIQADNAKLLLQIGQHLLEHGLELHDWDGRLTEHGKLWPTELLGGYNAAMSLAFMKTIVFATASKELSDFLERCMLMRNQSDPESCLQGYGVAERPFSELVGKASLYLGCASNWNNFAMHMLSLHTLLMLERDPELRATYQAALTDDMFDPPGAERPLREQNNSFYDFMFAADKALGPKSDGPAFDAVENGVCMLRQFPASEHKAAVSCPPDKCVPVCEDRFGKPMTDYPRQVAERCIGTFMWWGSPYTTAGCQENLRNIKPPADYLLPYWMGRYYGFIDATM